MSRLHEIPQPSVATIVWGEDDLQILLGLRTGKVGNRLWGFPGGKIDPGESPLQAAKRELTEETGLEGFFHQLLPYYHYDLFPEVDQHYCCMYTQCYAESNRDPVVVEPDKFDEWKFFYTNELPSDLMPGIRDALTYLDI